MATSNKITVKSRSPKGFRRAGIAFTREGVEVDPGKLKKGQLDAILSDPNLVVIGEVEAKPETAAEKKAREAAEKKAREAAEKQAAKDEAERVAAEQKAAAEAEAAKQAEDKKGAGK